MPMAPGDRRSPSERHARVGCWATQRRACARAFAKAYATWKGLCKMGKSPEVVVDPSPFRDLLGMRIGKLQPGRAELELDISPTLMNFVGRLHGGVVATLIDMAGTLAGYCLPDSDETRSSVTLSLTVGFTGTATSGKVRAVGLKRGGGRKIYNSTVDVFDENDTLIATGQGTYRYT
ncbi:MAG: PaaI family thioesterase [Rhodospirillaceae bacterium]|nr:MAG: PaaI family thioesterase [Rhodospirillaceae bacterium]